MPGEHPRHRADRLSRSSASFVSGASYPFRAFALFRRSPRLLKYIAIPIGLNVAVGVAFYWSLLRWLSQNLDAALAPLPNWLSPLGIVLQVMLILLLLLLTGLLFLQFGVLLGSPWYGRLSEELERLRLGNVHQPQVRHPLIGSVVDLWRAIAFEIKKLLLWLGITLPLLAFHLIPGLGTAIATIGSLGLAALITCMDFLDPALERRRLRFRRKIWIILHHLPATATFGGVCLALVSIPLLNLLAIPICVAAGTLLFCDRITLTPHLLNPDSDFPSSPTGNEETASPSMTSDSDRQQ